MILLVAGTDTGVGKTYVAAALARSLDAATLVEASDRLGCINHVLLTLGALEEARVRVAGLVLSAPEVPDESTGSNAAAIERLWPGGRVSVVARGGTAAAGTRHRGCIPARASCSHPADTQGGLGHPS